MSTPPATTEPAVAYRIRDGVYLNVTSACTLRCVFCPKHHDEPDWVVRGYDLHLHKGPDVDELVAAAIEQADGDLRNVEEVVFCGLGESTLRLPVILEAAPVLRERGARRLRVNTDGLSALVFDRDTAAELRDAGVDAVSVSLNAADRDTYAEICPSKYGPEAYDAVKAFIRRCAEVGLDVRATVVDLPRYDADDLEACRRVAEDELGVEFVVRPYGPLG